MTFVYKPVRNETFSCTELNCASNLNKPGSDSPYSLQKRAQADQYLDFSLGEP